MRSRTHLRAATTLLVALTPFTLKPALAAGLPSAGSQLQQIPLAPAADKAAPQVRIEAGAAAITDPTDDVTIAVNRLHVANTTAFSET
ncbi:MAG: ShlB/FhaC/HecB family hemolysin secretion/activation protein, partial [Steroidobacteraceae bacterium]